MKAAEDLGLDYIDWTNSDSNYAPHGCFQGTGQQGGSDSYAGAIRYNPNPSQRGAEMSTTGRVICQKATCMKDSHCGSNSVCNGGVCQASCARQSCPPGHYNTGIVGGEFDMSTCCRACMDLAPQCGQWAAAAGACAAGWMQAQCGISCKMCQAPRDTTCGPNVGKRWSKAKCNARRNKGMCSRNCHVNCNDNCKCNSGAQPACKDDQNWKALKPKKHKGKKCTDLGMQACRSAKGTTGAAKSACAKSCGYCRRLSVV